MYALDRRLNHVIRLAGARAVRTPLSATQGLEAARLFVPTPDPVPLFTLTPGEPENETTWAIETGYVGQLDNTITLRLDGYYQRFEDLIFFPGEQVGLTNVNTTANGKGADAWGIEGQLTGYNGPWSADVWYQWHYFEPDEEGQQYRAFAPAEHGVGVQLRYRFWQTAEAGLSYRYSSSTDFDDGSVFTQEEPELDDWHRLDFSITGNLTREMSYRAAIQDIFNETEKSIAGIGDSQTHLVPGRTILGTVRWAF
jgi:outer membrane cobalamin receptor